MDALKANIPLLPAHLSLLCAFLLRWQKITSLKLFFPTSVLCWGTACQHIHLLAASSQKIKNKKAFLKTTHWKRSRREASLLVFLQIRIMEWLGLEVTSTVVKFHPRTKAINDNKVFSWPAVHTGVRWSWDADEHWLQLGWLHPVVEVAADLQAETPTCSRFRSRLGQQTVISWLIEYIEGLVVPLLKKALSPAQYSLDLSYLCYVRHQPYYGQNRQFCSNPTQLLLLAGLEAFAFALRLPSTPKGVFSIALKKWKYKKHLQTQVKKSQQKKTFMFHIQ